MRKKITLNSLLQSYSKTKYKMAHRYLSNWISMVDELTSVEAFAMLVQADIPPEEMPSRATIHSLLQEIISIHKNAIENMRDRDQTTLKRNQRFNLLTKIATHPLPSIKEDALKQKIKEQARSDERKKIASSFHDTFRKGLTTNS